MSRDKSEVAQYTLREFPEENYKIFSIEIAAPPKKIAKFLRFISTHIVMENKGHAGSDWFEGYFSRSDQKRIEDWLKANQIKGVLTVS